MKAKLFIVLISFILPSIYCLTYVDDFMTLQTYAQDFGKFKHIVPRKIAFPTNVEEIKEALKYARNNDLKVIARGLGHNSYGYSQIQNGLIIDLQHMKEIKFLPNDRVEVQCGISFLELNTYLQDTNFIFPNNPGYIGLSVCGDISSLGIGPASSIYGSISEYVSEITVVLSNGEVKRCNRRRNSDLFNAFRGGLGQYGVIVSAKFALQPKPLFTWVGYIEYNSDDLVNITQGTVLALSRGYINRAVQGINIENVPSEYILEGATQGFVPLGPVNGSQSFLIVEKFVYNETSDTLDLTGFTGSLQTFSFKRADYNMSFIPGHLSIEYGKSVGIYYNPFQFVYYLVPASDLQKVIASITVMSAFMDAQQLIDHIEVIHLDRANFRNPLNFLKFKGESFFYLSLFISANAGTERSKVSVYTESSSLVYKSIMIYEQLLAIWGPNVISTVPYGYFPYSAQDHFGRRRFRELLSIKDKVDPSNLFNGGINLFQNFTFPLPHDDHHDDHYDHYDHYDHHDDHHDDHYHNNDDDKKKTTTKSD